MQSCDRNQKKQATRHSTNSTPTLSPLAGMLGGGSPQDTYNLPPPGLDQDQWAVLYLGSDPFVWMHLLSFRLWACRPEAEDSWGGMDSLDSKKSKRLSFVPLHDSGRWSIL